MSPQEPQGRRIGVGDTVTIVHRISAPVGAVVQARSPEDSTIATLVAPPNITREGDSVRIAYTVAVWAPGHSTLILPGAVIIGMDGRIDTLANAAVGLDVASMLPAGQQPMKVAPRPSHPWIPRADPTVLPFAVLLPLALLVIGVLQWQWRRRGKVIATPPLAPVPLIDRSRLDRWLLAGEARLALDHLEAVTRTRPELAEWRARVDAVRFAPSSEEELAALVNEGCDLAASGVA